MRKLATIQRVSGVRPIEGADKIEVVDVLGWSVVVKKGEFTPGDLCVYFEIDSFLPAENPAFAFLEDRFSNWGTKRGMRLKTIKLRKQISQGLVLAIADFPELTPSVYGTAVVEGEDVTEILNVEKWEPAEETRSNGPQKTAGAGKFPSFIRKTDQERVQNYINELGRHSSETFEVTLKLDGSSMTVYHVGKHSEHFDHITQDIETRKMSRMKFLPKLLYKVKSKLGIIRKPEFYQGVCSRNIELDINDNNHFSQYAREQDLFATMSTTVFSSEALAFQGELIAPTIQNNHEQVKGYEFHVFSVFDINKQENMGPYAARLMTKHAGLKYVPVLEEDASLWALTGETEPRAAVDKLLAYAEGPGMNPGVKREGVVFKSNQTGFSFKAISNSYLLKKEGK